MMRNFFCILVAGVWTTVCFPFAMGIMIIKRDRSASLRVMRGMWAPVLLWAGGARLKVEGLENVPTDRALMFACNHQSTIDMPAFSMAMPYNFRFVSKKALKYVPFMGFYLSMAGVVFVDRKNHSAAVQSLDQATLHLKAGTSIVMFAEGSRSESQEVMPFKKGPFALAIGAGVPVIPVTIEGSGKLMPKNSWKITPGVITIHFGKPIDSTQFAGDKDALLVAVRNAVIAESLLLGGKGGGLQPKSTAAATQ